MEGLPQVLKAKDIADFLNVSSRKAYLIMQQNDFPALRFGRTIRVKRADFMQWLEQQKVG